MKRIVLLAAALVVAACASSTAPTAPTRTSIGGSTPVCEIPVTEPGLSTAPSQLTCAQP